MSLVDLVINGIVIPDAAARGIQETLAPIDGAAQLKRTLAGTLVDVSSGSWRKMKASWRCDDALAPTLDGVWPGASITVDCMTELSYAVGGGAYHAVVPDSVVTQDGVVFYRPRLQMRVTSWSLTWDEWGAVSGWQLEAEEQ